MGFFCKIRRYFEELWHKICECRWKALLCAVISVAGLVVGIALFRVFRYSWWYCNRCAFAEKLFAGGFSLFFLFLLGTVLYYLCIVLCNLIPQTRFLNLMLLFVVGFYCGANTAATVECWSVWGVLYAIFVTLPEIIVYTLTSFLACCEYPARRRLKESFFDFRQCLLTLSVGFVVKFINFFVILRIITAVI